jgi:hypothetical protein
VHAERRTTVLLLALLYTVSGGLCLIAVVWPMNPSTPVGLLLAIGIVALA